MNDLTQRIKPDLGRAAADRLRAAVERIAERELRLHRVGDAKLLPHLAKMSPAWRGGGI